MYLVETLFVWFYKFFIFSCCLVRRRGRFSAGQSSGTRGWQCPESVERSRQSGWVEDDGWDRPCARQGLDWTIKKASKKMKCPKTNVFYALCFFIVFLSIFSVEYHERLCSIINLSSIYQFLDWQAEMERFFSPWFCLLYLSHPCKSVMVLQSLEL